MERSQYVSVGPIWALVGVGVPFDGRAVFGNSTPGQAVLSLPALMRWRRFDVGSGTPAACQ
jgi:hypothetical protein